jgi:hypothetical protein
MHGLVKVPLSPPNVRIAKTGDRCKRSGYKSVPENSIVAGNPPD